MLSPEYVLYGRADASISTNKKPPMRKAWKKGRNKLKQNKNGGHNKDSPQR